MEKEEVIHLMEFENDVCFVVDFKNMLLLEVENPDNIIELKDMLDTGNGYEFYYDPVKKNIADIPEGFVEQDTGPYLIEFVYLTKLQPQAMATAHGISVDMVEGKTDRELLDAIQHMQK